MKFDSDGEPEVPSRKQIQAVLDAAPVGEQKEFVKIYLDNFGVDDAKLRRAILGDLISYENYRG